MCIDEAPAASKADSESSDQTERMIRDFAVRTCLYVYFLMTLYILCFQSSMTMGCDNYRLVQVSILNK